MNVDHSARATSRLNGSFEGAAPEEIAASMRAGTIPLDPAFDRHLPDDLRFASEQYWTPLQVAATAGSWLRKAGARTVVDIGSGAGKFCVACALVTDCVCLGIEHRPRLVAAAAELARRFGVEGRVSFIEGAFGEISIGGVDAFYLYNPFGENLSWYDNALDETVVLGPERFRRDVVLVERFLAALPVGVHVITYNGFGGHFPSSFSEVCADHTLPNILRMWRKETMAAVVL
jgi:SAM-dependent methyltransferase